MSSPTCMRCGTSLEELDMSRGTMTIGGPLPALYNGVICTSCRKIECSSCKGSPFDAPCSWCGNEVSPAYERMLS